MYVFHALLLSNLPLVVPAKFLAAQLTLIMGALFVSPLSSQPITSALSSTVIPILLMDALLVKADMYSAISNVFQQM